MEEVLFTKEKLRSLIIPLVIEQLLVILVGMIDTIMVSSLGEYAVSAVSLVDSINIFIKQIFTATAAGGAIVASQYLGSNQRQNACKAAKQLFQITLMAAFLLSVICVSFSPKIIGTVFGSIDKNVYDGAVTYFYYTALTYPFSAVYNSSAALFRAMGNSRVSMTNAAIMNLLNIGGNSLLIFGFGMGIRGAAIATLFANIVSSLVMLYLITKPDNKIFIRDFRSFRFDIDMIKKILRLGIPNGIESGLFQAGRLVLSSLMSTFGTAAIAGNAVAHTVANFMSLPGNGVALSIPAVIGRSMGAGDTKAAENNAKTLIKIARKYNMFLNIVLMLLMRYILKAFSLGSVAYDYAYVALMSYGLLVFTIWPFSFIIPSVLRAAGDIKTTMIASISSMVLVRLILAYILAYAFDLGFYSVWIAMCGDWFARALIYYNRFRAGKWKHIKVI